MRTETACSSCRGTGCPDCGQATHCARCRAELREDERAITPHDLCDDCALAGYSRHQSQAGDILAATAHAVPRCAICLSPRPVGAGRDGAPRCERCLDSAASAFARAS